jgi:ParB-like chromosome segregation protein Spo0J
MSDIIETPIGDLIADERCQARETMNWDAVGDYRAAYEAGKSLPPLEVFGVKGKLIIVDGFHRYEAAIRAGVATLPVTIVGEGAMGDAVWEALSKNHRHGVRRTQADKRKAARKALARDDGMSDRAIAKHCGVSHTFVANMRKGKVEQLELTMPEPDTKEPRQTTDLRETVEDLERDTEWFRGTKERPPELADEASLARITDRLRLAKDNIATATMPGDREAATWLLRRAIDASKQLELEAAEYGIRCERELGARLADLEKKLPRDVYKAFLARPNAVIELCDKRIKELEQAS